MVDYPKGSTGDIHWYLPEHGRNGLNDLVSHMGGVRNAVQYEAWGLAREASMAMAAHRHRGRAHVEMGRHPNASPRTPDWYVYLRDADPGGEGIAGKNKGDRSAMSIEFGWTTKNGNEVPGLHILGGVMKRAARKYRGPR